MRLATLPASSPLVSTEYGVGFMDSRLRVIRLAFGMHVSPEPKDVHPATEAEAKTYFRARAFHRAELTRHYERADRCGFSTGD